MSDLIALSTLLLRSRQRADMVNSDFVDDTTEVTQWVNEAIASMYDKIIESREDYYVSSTSFSTASGTDAYLIGSGQAINISDFYKLKGVDVVFSGKDRRSRTGTVTTPRPPGLHRVTKRSAIACAVFTFGLSQPRAASIPSSFGTTLALRAL
jgi:hypothetical protein